MNMPQKIMPMQIATPKANGAFAAITDAVAIIENYKMFSYPRTGARSVDIAYFSAWDELILQFKVSLIKVQRIIVNSFEEINFTMLHIYYFHQLLLSHVWRKQ